MSAFHSLSDEWRLVIIRRDAYTVCFSLWLSELMAAGSVAAKLWDQYIRPIEDPLPPTPCLCFKLCEYLFVPSSAFACLHLCLWSVNLWVCLDIAAYLWFCEPIAGRDCWHTQIKSLDFSECLLSLVSVFQAVTANHYLSVFLPSPLLFALFCIAKVLLQQYVGLISKHKVLSGKSLQQQE